MTAFWWDQMAAWICVLLAWFVTHELGLRKIGRVWWGRIARIGLGSFGVSLFVITIFKASGMPSQYFVPVLLTCLAVFLAGVIGLLGHLSSD